MCVDDILLCGNDMTTTNALKKLLDGTFSIKDLGPAKYYLGLEIPRTSKGISLGQQIFFHDMLKTAGLLDCKSLSV